MRRSLLLHVATLRPLDLTGYTYEKSTSWYNGAKWDFIVYDRDGKAVAKGREFNDGQAAFWEP